MNQEQIARFLDKVEFGRDPDACWTWTASRLRNGYGQFWLDGRAQSAHVVSYLHFVGPIPTGHQVDHGCHNRSRCSAGDACVHRSCVRPDHLEAVTALENQRRSPNTGAAKTHCPSGHPYSDGNLRITPQGWRECRACNRARSRARYRSSAVV